MEIKCKGSDELVYQESIAVPKLHQNTYYVINDLVLLETIRQSCYTGNDTRASWIGPGLPYTHCSKKYKKRSYKNLAMWALQHWVMYSGFLDLIVQDSGLRMLDIGCGVGYATTCLSSIYPNSYVVGIDIDENCIKFANCYNSGRSKLSYEVADFMTWGAENSKYDYIFALEILEHLSPTLHYEFVDRSLSLLTKQGLLFITTPNELDTNSRLTKKNSKTGHVGLLNKERASRFVNRYTKNMVECNFYDNKKLNSLDPTEYIIKDPIETFDAGDGKNRSHFRLVMRREGC